MQAVVLAAGEGTRLRPLTEGKPKEIVEVDGKPILTHCFDRLASWVPPSSSLSWGISKKRSPTTTAMHMRDFLSHTPNSVTNKGSHMHCSPSRSTSTTSSCYAGQ